MPIAATPVTQFAVLDALLAGSYDSGIAVGDLLAAGDLGLGCGEHLGGEVVVIDGTAFECTADGSVTALSDAEMLPFAAVCRFAAGPAHDLVDAELPGVQAAVEAALVSRNLFHAVRVDGVFATVLVRATARQHPPYRPLAQVAVEQVETTLTDVRGTLVGFWSPAIYQGIAVAGLHLHFIADDRRTGGHVLAVRVSHARLTLSAHARLDLRLPTDERFLTTELDHGLDAAIGGIESR